MKLLKAFTQAIGFLVVICLATCIVIGVITGLMALPPAAVIVVLVVAMVSILTWAFYNDL
jgi:maltodextrin utilization protein YvdJ